MLLVGGGQSTQEYCLITNFAFRRVDLFTSRPLHGNPLAAVVDAGALTDMHPLKC